MARLLLLALMLLLQACEKKEPPKEPPLVEVNVMKIETKTIPAKYEYVGVAESSHLVQIRARVEGYLDKIAYTEGGLVKAGDLMFQLDPKPFEAKLANAVANLEKQKAILWNAKETTARLRPLYEKNAASKRDLDDAIAQELSAQAEVDAFKAEVVQAELNLGYTTITSPITGLANKSTYREGALITPGENGLLTTVSVIDPIWVNFNVSDGDILKAEEQVRRKQLILPEDKQFEMEVTLADGSKFPYKGSIDFASPILQQTTGTMLVRSIFKNPNNVLKPGQFVRATAYGAMRPNAISVPQKAVLQGSKNQFVYLVDKENVARPQPIVTGDWFENDWIILEGLRPGDIIITDGVNKIRPGQKVKPHLVQDPNATKEDKKGKEAKPVAKEAKK